MASVSVRRKRQAWAIAIAVSLVFHVTALTLFVRDWSARPPQMRRDAIELVLERPSRPPEAPKAEEKQRPLEAPPFPAMPALARPTETTTPPVLAPGRGQAPSLASGDAPGKGRGGDQAEQASNEVLAIPCLGRDKDRMTPKRRERCQTELTALFSAPKVQIAENDLDIGAKAKTEFDQGKAMRGCLVPHPDGGCLKDKGVTVRREF